jgi:phosphoribosylaminoimidazolecarboxamide formyltransferase/IMP cyclohydrolase
LLNGVLVQDKDLKTETNDDMKVVTEKAPSEQEIEDLVFANKIVKHTKSNAIVLAKNKQLCASGVGQTSRVDALEQAIEKAGSFSFDMNGAVMASDAFFLHSQIVYRLLPKLASPLLFNREDQLKIRIQLTHVTKTDNRW